MTITLAVESHRNRHPNHSATTSTPPLMGNGTFNFCNYLCAQFYYCFFGHPVVPPLPAKPLQPFRKKTFLAVEHGTLIAPTGAITKLASLPTFLRRSLARDEIHACSDSSLESVYYRAAPSLDIPLISGSVNHDSNELT